MKINTKMGNIISFGTKQKRNKKDISIVPTQLHESHIKKVVTTNPHNTTHMPSREHIYKTLEMDDTILDILA